MLNTQAKPRWLLATSPGRSLLPMLPHKGVKLAGSLITSISALTCAYGLGSTCPAAPAGVQAPALLLLCCQQLHLAWRVAMLVTSDLRKEAQVASCMHYPQDPLCKTSESTCPAEQQYVPGQQVESQATHVVDSMPNGFMCRCPGLETDDCIVQSGCQQRC